MHRFDSPMPPNYGEPLLGCHPVDSEAGDVIESFSIRLAKTIECIGIDTNKRSEVLPTIGCRWARSKKDASGDLRTPCTFYVDGVSLLQRALSEPQLSPVR